MVSFDYNFLYYKPLKCQNCRQQSLRCRQRLKNCFTQAISDWEFNDHIVNTVEPDEVAHYGLLHLYLGCLQI